MQSAEVPSLTIARLPLEVLEVVIQHSPLSSQLTIAQVSKLFHSLTLRLIYRHISLFSASTVVACCQTLTHTANHGAIKAVRSFMISYAYHSTASKSLSAAYYSITKDALHAITGLHTLKLLVHDPYFDTLLKHLLFPALRHFECYLTPSTPLIEFLNHHPKISYLQVSPYENTSESFTEEANKLPFMELPHLQYFAGNAQSVPYLGTASTLRAAFINWNAMDTDPDLPFSALQRSSHETLRLLSCRKRGWNLDLIDLISIRLPDVFSLDISNVLVVDANPTQTYLKAIRVILPRFNQLQRFRINCIDYWETEKITCRLEDDFHTVTGWGEACPSLMEIALPHSDSLSWYRISDNVWIPDPEYENGAAWLSEAVALKRYHNWGTFVAEDTVLNSAATPTDLVDIIANARRRLEDLIRTSLTTSLRIDSEIKIPQGSTELL